MSKIIQEPPVDPARSYFSQLCVICTGMAAGVVDPLPHEGAGTSAYLMGRRDAYHVVVAHLASSRTLREAADKCAAFGRGVGERADSHPYGIDWCAGFAEAASEAVMDLTMYAASGSLPSVDMRRLRSARAAVRHLSPLGTSLRDSLHEPPRSHHEW